VSARAHSLLKNKKTQDPASKANVQRILRAACPSAIVLAIYHADADDGCVPDADFFTGNLHFESQPDGAHAVTRRKTCPTPALAQRQPWWRT
jgi:hypothetical protein